MNGFFDFFNGGVGEVLGGGELLKKPGCDFVDSGVGALGGKDGGDQELPGVGVEEAAFGLGEFFAESGDDLLGFFASGGEGFQLWGGWHYFLSPFWWLLDIGG